MLKNKFIKKHLKRGAQHIACKLGPYNSNNKQPQLLVLMYHRILPAEDERCKFEEPGMLVTPACFKLHLDILADSMTFVSLAEWIERKNNGQDLPRNACAITFDDGWADNYEFAFPILKERSVPATIYLVSDMIGTNQSFWPERLARTLARLAVSDKEIYSHPSVDWLNSIEPIHGFNNKQPTQEQISQVISQTKIFSDDDIHSRINAIEAVFNTNVNDKTPSLLNWSQLQEMTKSGIIEAGSHTRHHTRLDDQINDSTLNDEIINSKNIIEKQIGTSVKTFCFPNGNYCDRSLDLVRKHYSAAVTVSTGWNSLASDNYQLNRIGVHQDIAFDKTAFLAKISGWL